MPQIRILTANLWNGGADPRALAEVIARYEPDAVLAQEMTPEHAQTIERLLPHGLLLPRRDKRGMGLALRKPASVSPLPLPRRDALIARVRAGAWGASCTGFEIINVHMSSPVRPSRLPLRRAQVKGLHDYLTATPMPRILAGDLNSLRISPAYRMLRRSLNDAALERRSFAMPTWSFTARCPRLLRIDHVLTHGFRTAQLEVVHIRGSDHSAVFAILDTIERSGSALERDAFGERFGDVGEGV
jgi:endonuclease/exonuclease/phosphatase family metal-dependent hydrolase